MAEADERQKTLEADETTQVDERQETAEADETPQRAVISCLNCNIVKFKEWHKRETAKADERPVHGGGMRSQ